MGGPKFLEWSRGDQFFSTKVLEGVLVLTSLIGQFPILPPPSHAPTDNAGRKRDFL